MNNFNAATDRATVWRTPPEVVEDCAALAGVDGWAYDAAACPGVGVAGHALARWCGPGHPRTPDFFTAPPVAGPTWCNPPYDRWGDFARVLATWPGVRGLLVFARTDTAAWHAATATASLVAFRAGRVKFFIGDRTGPAPAPTAFVVWGPVPRHPRVWTGRDTWQVWQ